VRGKARQKKGEKRVWWRLSPGAGKAAALGFNFDNGDMPPMDSFGQGEERGKEGHSAERLEASKERKGEKGGNGGGRPFMRGRVGIGGVRYGAG
jgi:hypothetical protein